MDRTPNDRIIPNRLFFRIGDVAEILNVKPYVLRYWEQEFPMIQPGKAESGHRVYKRIDVEMLSLIHHLLYSEKFSIEGARRRIKELKKEKRLPEAIQQALDAMEDHVIDSPKGKLKSALQSNADVIVGPVSDDRIKKEIKNLDQIKQTALELLEMTRTPIHQIVNDQQN